MGSRDSRNAPPSRVLVILGTTVLYGMERATIDTFDALRPEVQSRFLLSRQGAVRGVPLYEEVIARDLDHVLMSDHWSWPMISSPRSLKHVAEMLTALFLGNVDALRASRGCTAIYVPTAYLALYSLAACILFRMSGRRVVFEFHNVMKKGSLIERIIRLCHPVFTDFICGTAWGAAANRAEMLYIESSRLRVIPRTVPKPPRARPSVEREIREILCLGQVAPHKGTDILLDAFISIASQFPRSMLHIVGGFDQPFGSMLERRIEDAGVPDRVTLWGFRRDARKLLSGAWVFVQPTVPEMMMEMAPVAVLEAMAAGVPPIVFRSGALMEIVEDGKSGLVCPTPSRECLAEALVRMLQDPDLRARCSAGARARYGTFYAPERTRRLWLDVFLSGNVPRATPGV